MAKYCMGNDPETSTKTPGTSTVCVPTTTMSLPMLLGQQHKCLTTVCATIQSKYVLIVMPPFKLGYITMKVVPVEFFGNFTGNRSNGLIHWLNFPKSVRALVESMKILTGGMITPGRIST